MGTHLSALGFNEKRRISEKDEMATPHSDSKSPCYCYGDTLLLVADLDRIFSQPLTLLYYVSYVHKFKIHFYY